MQSGTKIQMAILIIALWLIFSIIKERHLPLQVPF